MNKLILVLILLSGTVILDSAVAKDYTRSCDCDFGATVETINGYTADGPSYDYPFSGQGTVGYYNPNEARRRARHNIDECLRAAWDHRDGTSIPTECTEANQIYNYPLTIGLIPEIRNNVCSRNPDYIWFTIGVSAVFTGDTGCTLDNNNWLTTLARNYRVNCPTRDYPIY
jgi:hypothetical protein